MISAVLDTNTIVSATLSAHGIPRQIVLAAHARSFRLIISAVIIAEVLRTLGRPRVLRRYALTAAHLEAVRELLTTEAVMTPLTVAVQGVATHPEDDLILATALPAQADYLVTGDRQLQNLGSHQGVQIVSPDGSWSCSNQQLSEERSATVRLPA
ncbi:MAG: putative toxin-antitoxin system toxin component, PIN family [Chloroflexi bacterium]|nr:putative toxin-antitoxin system toxin component, PIN family [Chloroflexota bacterium]